MSDTIAAAKPSPHREAPTAPADAKVAATDRVVSIDALRGFDMFWIIGGQQVVLALAALFHGNEIPHWLGYHTHHRAWEGFAGWDLIMPLFLFITGTSMPYSFAKRIDLGSTKGDLYRKIAKRVAMLFVLGMVVQGHLLDFDPSTLHIYCNTLQAIACGYCVAAILVLNAGVVWQVMVIPALLVVYWALMMFVPFGGHPAGTLQPDANLALAIDAFILGRFRDGTSYTWILSGLGFAATVLLGVLSGHVLRMAIRPVGKVLVLLGAGLVCLGLGWGWGNVASPIQFPIIKHLWTSSMVLWSGGWCFLLMGGFYLLIDVMGLRRWAFPLVVIGMNSIAVYVAVHLINFVQIADPLVGGLGRFLGPSGQELLRRSSALMIVWLILLYMYRKRTFIRV